MKAKNILFFTVFSCALIIVFVCLFFPIYYDTEFVYNDDGIAIDTISSNTQPGVFADIFGLFSSNASLGQAGSIVLALFLLLLLICGFGLCGLWLYFFIKKRRVLPISTPFLPFSLIRFAIILLGISQDPNILQLFPKMYTASYITFAVNIALVIFDLARLGLWLYHKRAPRAPRPPRPHMPTDKERIAELEKRISELEGKE